MNDNCNFRLISGKISYMSNEIQSRLAENIKKIRKEKHLTQFELAEKANISEAMVKSIETCHAWPSENTLLLLSQALFRLHFLLKSKFKQS